METNTMTQDAKSYAFVLGRLTARKHIAESTKRYDIKARIDDALSCIFEDIADHPEYFAILNACRQVRNERMTSLGYTYSQDTETYLTADEWNAYYG